LLKETKSYQEKRKEGESMMVKVCYFGTTDTKENMSGKDTSIFNIEEAKVPDSCTYQGKMCTSLEREVLRGVQLLRKRYKHVQYY